MGSDTVADLQRWIDAGGGWALEADDGSTVTVALLRCDGGEKVGTLVSGDPALRVFVER